MTILRAYNGDGFFFSYQTLVCVVKEGEAILDEEFWDYPKTTVKHVARFLNMTGGDLRRAVSYGKIATADLQSAIINIDVSGL